MDSTDTLLEPQFQYLQLAFRGLLALKGLESLEGTEGLSVFPQKLISQAHGIWCAKVGQACRIQPGFLEGRFLSHGFVGRNLCGFARKYVAVKIFYTRGGGMPRLGCEPPLDACVWRDGVMARWCDGVCVLV